MNRIVKTISSRLSLRRPQNESLNILARVLEKIELSKDPNLKRDLEVIKEMYPSVQDFERDFPSICFALATGVGKTRLMGAFISYLYLTGRSHRFFVLAPNLTIYEKLQEDFNPQSPKYVFRGIQEFKTNPPVIITGENYQDGKGVRFDESKFRGQGRLFEDGDTPFINIFNISKINAAENKVGATKSSTPRIKRLQETIGESYFEYLANLPDLVMLMDEAHHYRATKGADAINELKPMLGIELTATPKTTGAKPVDFKNIIYAYSLAEALNDEYVKTPAVATRTDFKPEQYTPEQVERFKLEDGIWHHEDVKAEIESHASNYDKEIVKPFMLVVAKDTNHARQVREILESDEFFEGAYKGKVAEIHSKQSGAEADENIQRLISIENPREPTEIVIHVNKLKEGWDVTNLYTIVPLRASASEILTEQTIGRGLRLPYGEKTGVDAIDRLTIIAHDKFQDIVDRANDPNSIIKRVITIGNDGDIPHGRSQSISVQPLASAESIIEDTQHQQIAEETIRVVRGYEELKNSGELSEPEIQAKIVKEVSENTKPEQEAKGLKKAMVKEIVEKVTNNFVKFTIDIPDIIFTPSQEVTYRFHDFDLDNLEQLQFKPSNDDILIQSLHGDGRKLLSREDDYDKEQNPENYIIERLREYDAIDYDEYADLLYKLTRQAVAHIQSYLSDEGDVKNVLLHNQIKIAEFIVAQLMQNYSQTPTEYTATTRRRFKTLKPFDCNIQEGTKPQNFRSTLKDKSNIRKMLFNGFTKCCYPLQKFDSAEGELSFARVLEDDAKVLRWMKPSPGFFKIEYKGISYEPDFVVETADAKYICEPKMASEMESDAVLAKKEAAVRWRDHANQNAKKNGDKPWHYALIPHDAITANSSFDGLMDKYKVS